MSQMWCGWCGESTHPFNYDLHLEEISHVSEDMVSERTTIIFHGYNQNYLLGHTLFQNGVLKGRVVCFNFPDYNLVERKLNAEELTFGTFDELLPALYVLKKYVIDEKLGAVDLYGYSAGGGALVNVLALLNSNEHDAKLKSVGIGPIEKLNILSAIRNGLVILDTPLKSMEEIIAFRGTNPEFSTLADNYKTNDLRPIDALPKLEGMGLNVLIHFQKNDEVLSNRDDNLFINTLMQVNRNGTNSFIIGFDGGHNVLHASLWRHYLQMVRTLAPPPKKSILCLR